MESKEGLRSTAPGNKIPPALAVGRIYQVWTVNQVLDWLYLIGCLRWSQEDSVSLCTHDTFSLCPFYRSQRLQEEESPD